jgi:hypothetical protein
MQVLGTAPRRRAMEPTLEELGDDLSVFGFAGS